MGLCCILFCEMTTRLPSPPLVVQEKVSEPPVLVAVVTIPDGPGGMLTGNVTFVAMSWKLSKMVSREVAPELKPAWQMPTCRLTPGQSLRPMAPRGPALLVIWVHESPEFSFQ